MTFFYFPLGGHRETKNRQRRGRAREKMKKDGGEIIDRPLGWLKNLDSFL